MGSSLQAAHSCNAGSHVPPHPTARGYHAYLIMEKFPGLTLLFFGQPCLLCTQLSMCPMATCAYLLSSMIFDAIAQTCEGLLQRGAQELKPKHVLAIYLVALALLCLVPAVRTVMLWTFLMWILTIGMHLFMDMAASIRAHQTLPKLL